MPLRALGWRSAEWRLAASVTSTTTASVAAATERTPRFLHACGSKRCPMHSAHGLPRSPPSTRSDASSGDAYLPRPWLDAPSCPNS